MKIEINELTNIINDVKEAVDKSAFGPMFHHTDVMDKQVNQLAWALYLHIISPVMKEYTETRIDDDY